MRLICIKYMVVFLGILSSCESKAPRIDCESLVEIEKEVLDKFNANEVKFDSRILKEELYFEEQKVFYVTVLNATTSALDFKTLSNETYVRFDNYETISAKLKIEGSEIVRLVQDNCNVKDFTNLTVVFAKKSSSEGLIYRFGNTYKI